jgi:hypothetical protein
VGVWRCDGSLIGQCACLYQSFPCNCKMAAANDTDALSFSSLSSPLLHPFKPLQSLHPALERLDRSKPRRLCSPAVQTPPPSILPTTEVDDLHFAFYILRHCVLCRHTACAVLAACTRLVKVISIFHRICRVLPRCGNDSLCYSIMYPYAGKSSSASRAVHRTLLTASDLMPSFPHTPPSVQVTSHVIL